MEKAEKSKRNMELENRVSKKYQIIYADPPWDYGKPLKWNGAHGKAYGPEHYYNTMSCKDINSMDIPAEKDCWLIMWATAAKLPEGIETLESWGFKYRTCAVWDKWHLGLGWFFRIQHEIILVGKRGTPPQPKEKCRSIFNETRTIHSKKPECVKKWIERAFPDCTKLELFARTKTPGWDVWGNEVESDIELQGL